MNLTIVHRDPSGSMRVHVNYEQRRLHMRTNEEWLSTSHFSEGFARGKRIRVEKTIVQNKIQSIDIL